ncbi:MAG: right-handed parallel beta-helix repeat-containing protein, partial [Streptosporangiaceae bacterium]
MARKALALVVALVAAGGAVTYVAQDDAEKAADIRDLPVTRVEAEKESVLVADEDRRLNQVRAITADAPKGNSGKPFRLATGAGYTLVLTQRALPYTVSDLLKLAPQTFVRQTGDGSYLLSENLFVTPGATLSLYNPGGLTVKMASSPTGFVSIVSFGGDLRLTGAGNATVKLLSWDARAGKTDLDPRDGRAYIRAVGGKFTMDYSEISNLGYWSGRTGGLGLTGTDRPNTGATQAEQQEKAQTAGENSKNKKKIREKIREQARQERQQQNDKGDGDVSILPPGDIATPGQGDTWTVPDKSFVTVQITRSRIVGNAFGIFVSGANGVAISDTSVEDSLLDGISLHRFTYNGRIERTISKNNRGDGVSLARASHDILITASTAEGNGGNGFSLNGQALADGASAAGESIEPYGNNTIQNSVARDNVRYGVEVLGGINIAVQNNEITGGDMGVVVRQHADKVTVVGNQVKKPRRQGVSIRDGVRDSVVTGNVIDDPVTGVYVRDAGAEVRGNTIQGAKLHGVSLVGGVAGSVVTYNVVTGAGPSAVDRARSHGDTSVDHNQTFGWHDTSSLWVQIKRIARPLTLLWLLIIFMLATSALQARRRRKFGVKRGLNPYDKQVLMEERPVR